MKRATYRSGIAFDTIVGRVRDAVTTAVLSAQFQLVADDSLT
jgi:hypothetical protein